MISIIVCCYNLVYIHNSIVNVCVAKITETRTYRVGVIQGCSSVPIEGTGWGRLPPILLCFMMGGEVRRSRGGARLLPGRRTVVDTPLWSWNWHRQLGWQAIVVSRVVIYELLERVEVRTIVNVIAFSLSIKRGKVLVENVLCSTMAHGRIIKTLSNSVHTSFYQFKNKCFLWAVRKMVSLPFTDLYKATLQEHIAI